MKINLHQNLLSEYILSFYTDNTTKLIEIPLGTIEADAKKKAQAIIDTAKACNGFTDHTK